MTLDELAKRHGVASFDLSKKLEAAGMPQDKSLWVWHLHSGIKGDVPVLYNQKIYDNDDVTVYQCAAPSATELADVLPEYIITGKTNFYWFSCAKDKGEYYIQYLDTGVNPLYSFNADTLPNALAKMVLYLLEKGILKKEDL